MERNVAIVQSCRYRHADFGDVKITVNGRARHIVARWIVTELRITIPRNLPAYELDRFLNDKREWIIDHRPAPKYHVGQVIDAGEVDFSIVEAWETDKGDIFMTMVEKSPRRHKFKNYYIHLTPAAVENIARAEVQEYIYKLLIWGAVCARTGRPHRAPSARLGRQGVEDTAWSMLVERHNHAESAPYLSASGTTRIRDIPRTGPPLGNEPLGRLPQNMRRLLLGTRDRACQAPPRLPLPAALA